MGQMLNLFTEPLIGEHGYLFSGNELGNNFCSPITDALRPRVARPGGSRQAQGREDPGWRPSNSETREGEWTGKSSFAFPLG